MKTRPLRLVLPLCFVASVLSSIHTSVFADATQHGAICRGGGVQDGNNVFLVPDMSGVHNMSLATLSVVCPVIRTEPVPAAGLIVWVDGYGGAGTASCTLYSKDYKNLLLGSVSVSAAAVFDMKLTLPASLVPKYSSQVVVCQLPSGGSIWDVEPLS